MQGKGTAGQNAEAVYAVHAWRLRHGGVLVTIGSRSGIASVRVRVSWCVSCVAFRVAFVPEVVLASCVCAA